MRRAWRGMSAFAALLAAASILLSALLWVQGGAEGRKARETQCDREPVTRKIAQAAYAVRENLPRGTRITPGELERFMAQAPKGCPPA